MSKSDVLRHTVASSSIVSVGYDAEQRILEVEFHQGEIYQYFEVPRRFYDAFLRSSSKGSFVNEEIRDAFRAVRVH